MRREPWNPDPTGAGLGASRRAWLTAAALAMVCRGSGRSRGNDDRLIPPARLADPIAHGPFLVPPPATDARPFWGIAGGIGVGLWPLPGPRGLLRIYAPYLDQPRDRVINFIAVEPLGADGRRGLSELEPSRRDRLPGKAIVPVESLTEAPALAGQPWRPPPARIEQIDGDDRLTLILGVEPFDNGAKVAVEVRLQASRPREIDLIVHALPGSAPMPACILTATMGNFARLRRLWLRDRVVRPDELWPPELAADDWGFLPHRSWPASELLQRADGSVIVAATTDETAPAEVGDLPRGWRYVGRPATQYWRTMPQAGLTARVNARRVYWMSELAIPGGPSYENFELEAPFQDGQRWTFGVHLGGPSDLGFPENREAGVKSTQPPFVEAHDPSLVREGAYYYVASTGRGRQPWIPLRRSRDLIHWEDIGQVFPEAPTWAVAEGRRVRTLWAPELTWYRDRFQLFYCASRFGTNDSTIARASAATLDPDRRETEWVDHGPVISSRPGRDSWNAIDPQLVVDGEEPWLVFGSFWDGIQLVCLDKETLKPADHPPMRVIARRDGGRGIEAPFLYCRGGWWYLFVSFDLCCRGVNSTYRIMVGRSRLITGPYQDRDGRPMLDGGGTEVLAAREDESDRGPGHCSVLQDGDGPEASCWLAHHAYDANLGGRPVLRIRPLRVDANDWPEAGAPVSL